MIETETTATYKFLARNDLQKYQEHRRSADALLLLAEEALERVQRVSKTFDAVRVQSQQDSEATLANAIDHKQQLQNKAREHEDACMAIENRIIKHCNDDESVILLRIYVFRQTVEQAATEMHRSRRQGFRLYNQALISYGEKMAPFGTK